MAAYQECMAVHQMEAKTLPGMASDDECDRGASDKEREKVREQIRRYRKLNPKKTQVKKLNSVWDKNSQLHSIDEQNENCTKMTSI